MKTLLLGMGNPILCDDAIGVRLARDFHDELHGVPDLDVMEECSVGGLNLLDVLKGYERAVVLDSIETQGGVAGRWHRFGAEALADSLHLTSIHDVNFATALELGRRLQIPLPTEIHIFAVEIVENRLFSDTMTSALERAYPAIASSILEEVRRLLPSAA
jgi:hydrogenase maturation protease